MNEITMIPIDKLRHHLDKKVHKADNACKYGVIE